MKADDGGIVCIKLYIYEYDQRRFRLYELGLEDPVPGMQRLPLNAGDFLYLAHTDAAWTHRGALDALEGLRMRFGAPFTVDVAFRRYCAEAGERDVHHFAGQAFEIGRTLSKPQKTALYHAALCTKPALYLTPRCLAGRSVRVRAQYRLPVLAQGDVSAYVFVLQEALLALGLFCGALTGRFDKCTLDGVCRMQGLAGRPVTGRMLLADWHALLRLTNTAAGARMIP